MKLLEMKNVTSEMKNVLDDQGLQKSNEVEDVAIEIILGDTEKKTKQE